MKNKISVLILTFNRADKLDRCLRSIWAGTYIPDEVVVVDNGSSDHTSSVVANYPVNYVRLHKNYGCPTGRNIGVQNCSGELVYMLDDDGWLEAEALSKAISTFHRMSKKHHLGAVVSHVELTAASNVVGKKHTIISKDNTGVTRRKNFSGGASLVCKAAFQESGGYPDDFWGYGEEFDVSLRMHILGYHIYHEPSSIMFHEAIVEKGRINRSFIYLNTRNIIFTVVDYYPLFLVPFAIAWYFFRWLSVSFRMRNTHFVIFGFVEALVRSPVRFLKFRTRIKLSQLMSFFKIG